MRYDHKNGMDKIFKVSSFESIDSFILKYEGGGGRHTCGLTPPKDCGTDGVVAAQSVW